MFESIGVLMLFATRKKAVKMCTHHRIK